MGADRVCLLWLPLLGFALSSRSETSPNTLGCMRRNFTSRVVKTDFQGLSCWDDVKVVSCWGRCDSNEISDWRFPFKRSHHPVCLHDVRKPRLEILKNCEPGVEPGTERYEFLAAESCRCMVCKSSEASCEGLRFRGVPGGGPATAFDFVQVLDRIGDNSV